MTLCRLLRVTLCSFMTLYDRGSPGTQCSRSPAKKTSRGDLSCVTMSKVLLEVIFNNILLSFLFRSSDRDFSINDTVI